VATVDQTLRSIARGMPEIPYWVLEKDYALSYLLAGIVPVEALNDALILKGGTALRKLYFPQHRFSEDLDFSTQPDTLLSDVDAAMQQAIRATEQLLQSRGPFEVQWERLLLPEPHPGGQDAFTVRVRFPSHRYPQCRLKVEITRDEPILLPPAHRQLLHAYPETLSAQVACYPLEEIVAEKLRALLQSRQRLQARGWGASRICRDYYDLWIILRAEGLRSSLLPDLVARKCAHRQVLYASYRDFFSEDLQAVARSQWDQQLRPFVPGCPEADRVLQELPHLVAALLR
jgi:uncharacterized protein